MGEQQRVVIGMDPHKRSVTVEVMEADESIVGHGRFGTDTAGFAQLVGFAAQWPARVWAIEGCRGIGRHVAQRLIAAGEQVVDVPAKLSARMRMFATGQGRKTDDTDAHSIALVGVRIAGLRPVVSDEKLEMLRLLVDRRRRLGDDHTRMICQLHQLLLELVAGGAKKNLSAAQARKILAGVRPTDEVGKLRKRGRAGAGRRPRADLPAQEASQQGTHRAAHHHRHDPARPPRHGPLRYRPAARRGR